MPPLHDRGGFLAQAEHDLAARPILSPEPALARRSRRKSAGD
jgi:hypothetical protein